MKLVYVTNGQDTVVAEPKRAAVDTLIKTKGIGVESYFVDFNDVRHVLPITSAPCVFLLFDELSDDFDPDNLDKVVKGVKLLNLVKGAKK